MMRGISVQQLKWEQYQADFAALSAIGQNADGGVDRLAYTAADQDRPWPIGQNGGRCRL